MISGGTANVGSQEGSSPVGITIRVTNVGSTDLTLDTSAANRPAEFGVGANASGGVIQPASSVVAPTMFVEFNIAITPDDYGAWSIPLSIYSDDPDEAVFTFTLAGTSTKAKDDGEDEGCTTGEAGGPGLVALLALLGGVFAAARLRALFACL